MNRTGLLVAVGVAAVVGALFGYLPQLDLYISELFFAQDTRAFSWGHQPRLMVLRDASMWVIAALAMPAVVALAAKLLRPRSRLLVPGRAIVLLLSTLALAPGLLTNVVLKEYWGRSRPIDVHEFGGAERFVPWWDPRGDCARNCSFVAGEGAGAFWAFAPAALTPPPWRPLAYAAALAFGTATGALRIAFGGHFFSDVVFSGVFTFLIVWLMHGLLYRWAATRTSDEAIEQGLERPGKSRLTRSND
ncbi:MAG TPA: phosphatase PAP2 family protein [Xanthobacteraceae bacterium]|jgi:membrane-associated PAP2 superfamily phosphatase|nr:phosphatase PAP2 family protein [Xanthobacteraceae bacterium]